MSASQKLHPYVALYALTYASQLCVTALCAGIPGFPLWFRKYRFLCEESTNKKIPETHGVAKNTALTAVASFGPIARAPHDCVAISVGVAATSFDTVG